MDKCEFQKNRITVKNSDRITFLGDSYTESDFAIKDKAYISKLSLFSEYCFENYAVSGNTYQQNTERVRNNCPVYHTSLGYRDFDTRYAVLISYGNDLKYENHEEYFEDLKEAIETVMALGSEPILATEYHENHGRGIAIGLKSLADCYGVRFMNLLPQTRLFNMSRYEPFWVTSHPGIRCNELFSENIEAYLNRLARPKQSIKLFRKRGDGNVEDINELLFDTTIERACRWKEISVGHKALAEESEKLYDRLNATDLKRQKVTSEYLKLIAKENVEFPEFALADIILPMTAVGLEGVVLHLSDPEVTVYGRNMFTRPYTPTVRYQAFYGCTGSKELLKGTKYASDAPELKGKVFTYIGTQKDKWIFDPMVTREALGAGKLIKIEGAGPDSVPYTSVGIAFSLEYYAQYGKPEGKWVEIPGDRQGNYFISKETAANFMKYDKLSFLLRKPGGFVLNDIYAEWWGQGEKHMDYDKSFSPQNVSGAELLTQTLMEWTGEPSGWEVSGEMQNPSMPADGVLPYGTERMLELYPGSSIKQVFSYPEVCDADREIQIKVWARYFPPIFDPETGDYPEGSAITGDSFDYAMLKINCIQSGTAFGFSDKVGLHWKEVSFTALIPAFTGSQMLELKAVDKNIQIARASVRMVKS